MPSDKVKRYLIIVLVIWVGIAFIYLALKAKPTICPLRNIFSKPIGVVNKIEPLSPVGQALDLVRTWRNKDALVALDKILAEEPNNPDAIWGRAEIFRRSNQNKLAELMFQEILNTRPGYAPALTSLAFIRYKEGNFNEALNLLNQALIVSAADRPNQALAYMILGLINNDLPGSTRIIPAINRGWKIRNYLLKAGELAPELPETHLYLGKYYLSASLIEGGSLNNAIKELEFALNIAPDFPEAKAALAEAREKKNAKVKTKEVKLYRQEQLMLGTLVEIISPDSRAPKIAFAELRRIEKLLNKYNPRSEVAKLNQTGSLKASPETFYIIKTAKEFWQASSGAFDITVAPLVDLWGFTNKRYTVPKAAAINTTLKLIGSDKIILQDFDNVIQFRIPGMKIDLGGIAKGYALDCAVKKLKGSGINNCLLNVGGQVYCLGNAGSKPWKVGIISSRGKNLIEYLELKDKAVATSGDYEQYFVKDKKRYSHILNPATGYPADSGVSSVTVIADSGLAADALATAIFVLGKDKGEKLADQFSGVKIKVIEETDVQNR